MEWIEVSPLPNECQGCHEKECYNCDHAGKRWVFSREDELKIRRKGLFRAIERLQKQIDEIDKALLSCSEKK